MTYLASPFAEIAPGGEGLCPPARARLRLEFSISHWSVCDRLLMFCRGISPSNHTSPSGSIPLGSERKTNETSPNEAEGQCSGRESPVSKVNYFRRPNEPPGKGRRGVKPAVGRSGTPARVRLPLSMPNDELVLTRRTGQRRIEEGRGEDIQTPLHRLPGKIIYRQLPPRRPALSSSQKRREFLYSRSEGHRELRPSVRSSVSLSHKRDRGTGPDWDHSLLSSPKFPIHYVDTWPRRPGLLAGHPAALQLRLPPRALSHQVSFSHHSSPIFGLDAEGGEAARGVELRRDHLFGGEARQLLLVRIVIERDDIECSKPATASHSLTLQPASPSVRYLLP